MTSGRLWTVAILVGGYSSSLLAARDLQAVIDLYGETNMTESCDAVAIARDSAGGMAVVRECSARLHGVAGVAVAGALVAALLPTFEDGDPTSVLDSEHELATLAARLGRTLDGTTRRDLEDLLDGSAAALVVAVSPEWVPRVRPLMLGADQLQGAEIDVDSPSTLGTQTEVT